ncbi:hypothetical protein Tco_0743526 [Tanacetum coccineum]
MVQKGGVPDGSSDDRLEVLKQLSSEAATQLPSSSLALCPQGAPGSECTLVHDPPALMVSGKKNKNHTPENGGACTSHLSRQPPVKEPQNDTP